MIAELKEIRQNHELAAYGSFEDWQKAYYNHVADRAPIEKAIIGGFMCQQFSYAFMAGYEAALEKMFSAIAPNQPKALCVSEKSGTHPKMIKTTLINNRINGAKSYIAGGTDMSNLLVLCKTNQVQNGRPILKMVHVKADAHGVNVENFDMPFMKEVHHGRATFDNVVIEPTSILEGDGYADYAVPFRSLEDTCLGAAYQAMLLRQAIENNWDADVRDQLLLNLHTFKTLLEKAPDDRETHLLISKMEANFKSLLPAINEMVEKHSNSSFQKDWKENQSVLSLGEKMKKVRLEKAREVIFG